LQGILPADACKAIRELESSHGYRRKWVWAEQGMAPLACPLPALVALADVMEAPVSGATPEEIAAGYVESGWKADAAVIDALAGVDRAPDVAAVKGAVEALYRVWLRATA